MNKHSYAVLILIFPVSIFSQNLTVEAGYASGKLTHVQENLIRNDAEINESDSYNNSISMLQPFSGGSYSDPYYKLRYDHIYGKKEFTMGGSYSKKETEFQSREYFDTKTKKFIPEAGNSSYSGVRNHYFSFYSHTDYEIFGGMNFGFLFQKLFITPGMGIRGMNIEYFRGRDSYAAANVLGQNGYSADYRAPNHSDIENRYSSKSLGGFLFFETVYRASKKIWFGHSIGAYSMKGNASRGELYGTFGSYSEGKYTEFATYYEKDESKITTDSIRNVLFLEYGITYSFRMKLGVEGESFQSDFSGFNHKFTAINYFFINNTTDTFIKKEFRNVINPELLTDTFFQSKTQRHSNNTVFFGFKLILNLQSE